MSDLECVLIAIIVVLVIVLVSRVCKKKTENASDIVMNFSTPALRKAPTHVPAPAPAPKPALKTSESINFKAPLAASLMKSDIKVAGVKIKNWFK